MKIVIEGTPKEIADLVLEVQGQPEEKPILKRPNETIECIRNVNRAVANLSYELIGAIQDYYDLR